MRRLLPRSSPRKNRQHTVMSFHPGFSLYEDGNHLLLASSHPLCKVTPLPSVTAAVYECFYGIRLSSRGNQQSAQPLPLSDKMPDASDPRLGATKFLPKKARKPNGVRRPSAKASV